MASLQAKIDAVKAAVPSTSTCTPATVVALKELLLPEPEPVAPKANSATRTTKTTSTIAKSKPNGPNRPGAKAAGSSAVELMSSRERTVLATFVINVTIKSLTEAAKLQPLVTPSKPSNPEIRQSPSKRPLRRSLSTPLSPMQTRTLNRVATSPAATKTTKLVPPTHSTGCLSTVECARVAFAALRSAKGPVQLDQTDFQVENGMSTLVAKLLALGLHEPALKELRVLKRRLDTAPAPDTNKTTADIAELLDYHKVASKASMSTVTTCQIQVLKLVSATKKPAHIESLLPVLTESHASSPVNLLSQLAKESEKEAAKAARNMASLSQLLLSLVPSVSSREDHVASEPRLSPSPSTAFRLQALAFRTQLAWWKLAGHKGNADDEILSPFSRCIKAFARRQKPGDDSTFSTMTTEFDAIMQVFQSQKHQPTSSSTSPLASIYHLLGSTAQTARRYDDAYRWLDTLKKLQPSNDSSVHGCSVSARLLAVALKRSPLDPGLDLLVTEVTGGLDGNLSGTVADLNELLESLSLTRRSAVGILSNALGPSTKDICPKSLVELLKTFILRYPRFLRRWLGAPPGKDAPAKQVLQFDQRRQLLTQSINQVLDAALMVIKCDIQSAALSWQSMDDVLQDCSLLLGSISDPISSPSKAEQLSGYRVKISSLYFAKFSHFRKETNRSRETNKQILQALNRSIDAVKDCSPTEQEKAQLPTKLELFADLCTGSGRPDDAIRTLRSICTNMAECGVLSSVADVLSSQSPAVAWELNEKTLTLSRTLRSIAKLDKAWNDWTFFLPEAERAAVLEHLMHISTGKANLTEPLRLHDSGPAALLRIYTLEKYPIRRLRVLLHLFYQNIGDEREFDEITSQVDQALRQLQKKDKAEDAGLSNYIPHLQTYHTSIAALAESNDPFPVAAMKDAVSSWRSMINACSTKEDIYAVIDDPDTLLEHLQSANQLAGLRGECHVQLSMLELSIAIAKACAGSAVDSLISGHSLLATQYVNIGLFLQASKTLEETRELVLRHEDSSPAALISLHLSQAEYYTEIGSTSEAMDSLSKVSEMCNAAHASWAPSKSYATMARAMMSFLQSTVALQKGDVRESLSCIKSRVHVLSNDWAKLEASTSSAVGSDTTISDTSITKFETKGPTNRLIGPRFWDLAYPLIRCLLQISSVYAHVGMFQETMYYSESAFKIAESTQSSLYKARVSAWMGSLYFKAGKLDNALTTFNDAESWMPHEMSSSRVRFARQLGDFYQQVDEHEKALKYFKMAEDTAHLLSGDCTSEAPEAPKTVRQGAKSTVASRTTRTTRATVPAVPKAPTRGAISKAKTTASVDTLSPPKEVYQASLFAAIILSRAIGFIQQKDWASALTALDQAKDLPKLLATLSQEQVVTAMSLIGQSMEQMIHDPIFSVMQDSTISFPAISGATDMSSDKTSQAVSPTTARSTAASKKGAKFPPFADALKQAQVLLLEAHASALARSDSSTVCRISTLLQDTILLLSATSATKSKLAGHPGFATVAVDLARNITWRREQKTLQTAATATEPPASNTTPPKSSRRSSFGFTNDMARFQKSYVEMIPRKWSVISMSLSDNQHDLCITKFQAGHSPFILRLPLERAYSRDSDSDVFSFEHGREELLDTIKMANETSHSARDFTARGERSAWWSEREALDKRLESLLATIESTWLGGFRGIFSQHQRRTDLLARFQKSFHQVLDGCLPSRSKLRGKKVRATPSITLDPRIVDLFIGLGDPSECDFDEELNDLLYFVVDVLQFHGERNAYDEIDFDAMLVETYDALRGYHSAAKAEDGENGAHTVLVLDKALHAFPWESMPCMDGLAVSRVPSLACLQRLISESKGSNRERLDDKGSTDGHYVSATSGTYILNPSMDLKNTQTFFQKSFASLESWTGIVERKPEEMDFAQAMTNSEVLVYFGHGSGAQYVRGKTIRRLGKIKPATFLMGCSSAALTEAGEFECYGPVWNYMMAGCPAVVGTLWDVTDRDIDRFAGRAFEEWGLFPRGTFEEEKKGKGKATSRDEEEPESDDGEASTAQDVSLAEAVTRARAACRFKYLNAAAVVLYGIPVYIGA